MDMDDGFDNQVVSEVYEDTNDAYYGSRIERRLDELEYREEQISAWLRRGIYVIIALFFVVLGIIAFRYVQMNREAPKTYNDLQLRIWREAVARNPKNPTNHANLGFIYFRTGAADQALYEFATALRLDPKHVTARYYRGLLYKDQKKASKALKDFEAAAANATEGNRFLPYYEVGQIYEKRGNLKKALDAYQKSMQDKPLIWNSHYALGRVYEKLGDREKALSEYQSAAKFNPDSGALKRAIARLREK